MVPAASRMQVLHRYTALISKAPTPGGGMIIERKLCIGSARRHITVQVMPFRFARSRDSRKPIRFFCEFAGGTNIKRNLQPFRPHIGVVQEGEPYMDAALRFKREGNIADRYSRAAI